MKFDRTPPASSPAEAPDLSGYDRNVRTAKMLQGIDGTGKQQPVDDPFSEPFTLIEKWIRRGLLVVSALVGIGVIVLAAGAARRLWL